MPDYKCGYFAPDGTFFDTEKECKEYELLGTIVDWLISDTLNSFIRKDINWMVSRILLRYKVEQKYDWRDYEEPKTLGQTIISTLKEDVSNGFYDDDPAPKVEPESK